MTQEAPRIRCRQIVEADIHALVELLSRGFAARSKSYWERALDRLTRRDAPADYPRYGYMLEFNGAPVGVVLLIYSALPEKGAARVRCNISSWYVDPLYRGYASLLIAAAVRNKNVTYFNVSPAVHTWPVIEAQGFRRYCDGQMLAIPALSPWVARAQAREFDPKRDYGEALSAEERDIMAAHVEHGCAAYVVHERREAHPFVFLPRRMIFGLVPTLQLVYCRGVDDFTRFSGPLGRSLLKRGYFTVLLDAPGFLPGLIGKFFHNRGPKYFKGPEQPRLGDLAFTESILFGP